MSLCFLSLETSKVFNQLILKHLEKEGFIGLSETLIILFPYIDEEKKITASKLAKKVGYTRQAMHKNIKKLEELGYITLTLENQKEKNIQFTSKSEKLMQIANEFIMTVENDLSQSLGKKELESYKKNQEKIYNVLELLSTK